MKKILCKDMGGDSACEEVITGSSAQEMLDNGWKHLQEVHPERAQAIMANPKEENDKWMEEFKRKFETLPDAE